MRRWDWRRSAVTAVAGCLIVSCGSPVGPPDGSSRAVQSTPAGSQITSSGPTIAARAPSVGAPSVGAPSPAPSESTATGLILFSRHNLSTDDATCFSVRPDGSDESPWAACGPLSPNGRTILTTSFKPNGFGPLLGGRPATSDATGKGFRVLDALPKAKISLSCSSWSPDGARFLCESGEDTIASDDGIYTLRASDGGDLRRITTAPAAHEDQPWGYAPDGSRILFERLSDDEPSIVYIVDADGGALTRLSTPDLSASDFSLPASWSPDGSEVAFSATKNSIALRSIFVVKADGAGLKEISPTDVGGASAQWSPDGHWIAFTSRTCCGPQVWIVHPDGTGSKQLTTGEDGSTSLAPLWSPDGSAILFHRDVGGHQTLRTIRVDGTGETLLADAGDGFDVGSYWWLAPPAQ